ncbi:MMPL family transporter [Kitasatospora kazusensis]|uniref:MMPL family transporter n=1 Tax=Kitasatospora kazusensis TaxID=407974 RepID=A0ABP4KBY4_9ACTN
MATLLYRLGRTAYRRRRLVLGIWLALLAALVACGAAFGGAGRLDNQFTIPGSESQRALDAMKHDFPAASGTSAQLVFTAPAGQRVTDARYAAILRQTDAAARTAPQVAAVIPPAASGAASKDGSTAITQVQYSVGKTELKVDSLDRLKDTTRQAEAAGLDVRVGGAAFEGKGAKPGAEDVIGLLVALVVLAVTFGSLLSAGMPLLTAFLGIGVGVGGVLALTGVATVSQTAITLALMIGLAVGIDYALFILSRHRSQLAEGTDPEESAALATGTAGGAVVFAGLTVIIALAGLSIVGIPFLTVMGLAAAGAVLVAVAVATTLLPAVLGFAGERLRPAPGSRAAHRATTANAAVDAAEAANAGERWARIVTRRPLLTVLAVVAVLGCLALPAAGLRLALPDNGSAPAGTSQRAAYDRITQAFGSGFNGPLLILTDTSGSADAQQATERIARTVRALPDVAAVAKPVADPASHASLIQVIPASGPSDQATKDLVHAIRGSAAAVRADTGATIEVTGNTAVQVDVSAKLGSALLPFTAVVVGLALVLLLLVFRSLVVPVKATAGFLLSVAATFGAVVAVFQWGWFGGLIGVDRTGPVASFLPVILIAVLFGLAMDYEVFLVSRMREEYVRTGQPLRSVHAGARHASRVVTAAALIMFSVFAAFINTDDSILRQIAFSLALGVLLDAFLVRMTLVPAVLALAGRAAWWLPAWLSRLLPDLDIEGERLHRDTRAPAPQPRQEPSPEAVAAHPA